MLSEKLAEMVIVVAATFNKDLMGVLADHCMIICEGNNNEYKKLFNDTHKVLFEMRNSIPWSIKRPTNFYN